MTQNLDWWTTDQWLLCISSTRLPWNYSEESQNHGDDEESCLCLISHRATAWHRFERCLWSWAQSCSTITDRWIWLSEEGWQVWPHQMIGSTWYSNAICPNIVLVDAGQLLYHIVWSVAGTNVQLETLPLALNHASPKPTLQFELMRHLSSIDYSDVPSAWRP